MRGDSIKSGSQQDQRDIDLLREKVERLTGERGDALKTMSAVRRVELQALASIPMQSAQITAAPTQAQYNALQADVNNIFVALKKISNLLGTATISKM